MGVRGLSVVAVVGSVFGDREVGVAIESLPELETVEFVLKIAGQLDADRTEASV